MTNKRESKGENKLVHFGEKNKNFFFRNKPNMNLSLHLNKSMVLHGSLYLSFCLSGICILSFKGIFWQTIIQEVLSKSLENSGL